MKALRLMALVVLLGTTGCASIQVEPWVKPYERANLADPIMSPLRIFSTCSNRVKVREAPLAARTAAVVATER